jgi:hypothetical protein
VQAQSPNWDEKCKKLEKKTIQIVVTNTISYTIKPTNKE